MNTRLVIGSLLLICLSVFSCERDKDIQPVPPQDEPPYVPVPYTLQTPSYFPTLKIPEDNPLTKEGVDLGRRLYHDPLLSKNGPNNGLSCSSCHYQVNSFSNHAPGTSVLPHVNLGWSTQFLWNAKVQGSLEDVMRFEVEDFFQADMEVLTQDSLYPELFRKAFGTSGITSARCAKALAQWFRIMVSSNSKYDKVYRNEEFFTDAELHGYDIFFSEKGDCFHCHGTSLFKDDLLHNNGLDAAPDAGFSEVTGNPSDKGKFKTPTLRNIELTAPYMHDGRYSTLEEVIDFYSEGIAYSPTIDPLMKKVWQGGVQLTAQEKADLLAFLKTLTDTSFTNNPELQSPL